MNKTHRFSVAALGLAVTLANSSSAIAKEPTASFTFPAAPLNEVLSAISRSFGRNLVGDASFSSLNVSLTLRNVTFDQAIDTIDRAYHLNRTNVQGTTVLSSSANGSNQALNAGVSGAQSRSISLHNATASVVAPQIQALLGTTSLVAADTRQNALIILAMPDQFPSIQSIIASFDGKTSAGTIATVTVPLNYAEPKVVVEKLRAAYGDRASTFTAVDSLGSNSVVLTGPQGLIDEAGGVIAKLDVKPRQVSIRVRVLDITPVNDTEDLGAIFGGYGATGGAGASGAGTPTANSFFTPFHGMSIAVNASINSLIQHGTAKVLAEPNTIIQNGATGNIIVGTEYPSVFTSNGSNGGTTVTTVNAGVIMKATPTIGNDGTVTLKLHSEYSQITGFNGTYPILSKRAVDTELHVNSGSSVVFAGLTQDSATRTSTKVPLLGDIPLFGRLFRNEQTTRNKEEITFVITPEIEDV